jgi:hypothetical protein
MHDLTLSNSLADLAARIKAEHTLVLKTFRRGLEHAIACGELLKEAKGGLEHGQWLSWLDNHTELSPRVAQNYMRLADHRDTIAAANTKGNSHSVPIGIETALELLRVRSGLPYKTPFKTLREEISADREQRWQAIDATAPEGLDSGTLRLCKGVYLQQVDDDRANAFYGKTVYSRALQLTQDDVADISVLAETRAELIKRAETLEAKAEELRKEAREIQRRISAAVRRRFLPSKDASSVLDAAPPDDGLDIPESLRRVAP